MHLLCRPVKITYTMVFNRRTTTLFILGLFTLLFMQACRENPERHLQLGNWYLQRGLLDESVLEFKEVTRILTTDIQGLTREEFGVLTKAHYNLALVYTKKGWWNVALKEAETCFELQPTKDNYNLVELIRQRAAVETADSDNN